MGSILLRPLFAILGGVIYHWIFSNRFSPRTCGLEYETLRNEVDGYRQQAHQLSQKVKLYEERERLAGG